MSPLAKKREAEVDVIAVAAAPVVGGVVVCAFAVCVDVGVEEEGDKQGVRRGVVVAVPPIAVVDVVDGVTAWAVVVVPVAERERVDPFSLSGPNGRRRWWCGRND